MQTETEKITLAQIVQPLVAVLNHYYPGDPQCPWEVVSPGQYRNLCLDDDEVAIPLDHDMTALAERAIATVLQLSSPDPAAKPDRHQEKPLFFCVVKETCGVGPCCISLANLIIYFQGPLDVDAAFIQIAKLVARLAEPECLVPLTEEQARMF